MKKIIKFFIDNAKVFNTIAVALILSGVYLYFFGKKEGFPSVKFDQIYINTIYPGASADEVERIVTRKIEEEIKRVNGAKRVTSQSIENLSTVVFEVEADASKNFQKVLNDVKTAVDRVTDLPAEVKKSDVFELDFDLFPAISVLVVGDKEENLQLAVRQIEDDLKNIKGVGKVNRVGYRDREIWVEADPDKLKAYQLGMSDVITAIRLRNISLPGGKLQMSGREYFVRTRGQFQNIEEISETVVRANLDGRIVRVKDLANVRWDFEEATQVTRAVGTLGIRLNILKKKSGDIINVADAVKAKINHYNDKKLLPGSVRLFYADDQSFFVKRRLHVLQDNATIGLILVVLCLILFFDGVTTFWATAGVPIVFATALLYLNLFGYTLNLMSMFGFIIVIGFLVDDAVVVAENIFRHREMGKDPMKATLDGAAEVFQPVQATTLTTIIAFSSLLMLPGIFGKFLSIVSVVVTVTMLLSLLETFGFLPGRLVYSLQALHGNKEQNRTGMRRLLYEGLLKNFFTRMGEWYRGFVKVLMHGPVWAPLGAWLKRRLSVVGSLINTAGRILRLIFATAAPVLVGVPVFLLANFLRLFSKRFFKDAAGESLKGRITRYRAYFNMEYDRALWPAWTLILVTVFNIALLVVGFTFVKKEFFPGATDEYVVKIELPVTSPLDETQVAIDDAERRVKRSLATETREVISTAGTQENPSGPPRTRTFVGGLRVILKPDHKMKDAKIRETLEHEIAQIPGLTKFKVEARKGGPPTLPPVAIKIFGDDLSVLKGFSDVLQKELAKVPNTSGVSSSMEEPKDEFLLAVDEAKASSFGVSVNMAAVAIRNAFNGGEATKANSIPGQEKDVTIRVKYPKEQQRSAAEISEITVVNNQGRDIPVRSFAQVVSGKSIIVIEHEDEMRLVTVFSELKNPQDRKYNSAAINTLMEPKVRELLKDYPTYHFKMGGEEEDRKELSRGAMIAMLFVLGSIYVLLLSLFRSFIQPIIVIIVVPYAIAGVMLGLWWSGVPFGFMPILGIVALVGVIVKSTIIMVSFINNLRARGRSRFDATIEGSVTRLRPILATSITGFIGLIPLAYGLGGKEPFLQPMAVALAWGLAFGTVVTLIILPCMYYVLDGMIEWTMAKIGASYTLPYDIEGGANEESAHTHVAIGAAAMPQLNLGSIGEQRTQ